MSRIIDLPTAETYDSENDYILLDSATESTRRISIDNLQKYEPTPVVVETDLIQTVNDWHVTVERSMSIYWRDNINPKYIEFYWGSSTDIGGNIVKRVAIPPTAKKIRYKIYRRGASYSNGVSDAYRRFYIGVGVRRIFSTGIILNTYNVSDWLAFKDYAPTQDPYTIEDYLDLSAITDDTYLYVLGHGWRMHIQELVMEE